MKRDETPTSPPRPSVWHETPLSSPIARVAVPIISVHGQVTRVSGTACIIAPWLAITARHVIEGEFRAFGGRLPSMTGTYEALHRTLTLLWPVEGRRGISLHVHRSWCSNQCDLAALWLAPDQQEDLDIRWACPVISLTPPRIGSSVAAFGFPKSETVATGASEFQTSMNPMTSAGSVVEVHNARRDRSFLSFPCFRTNLRFDGGMSGGPVFDDKGKLCGLVCASMPNPDDPAAEHVSYASSLWPLLSICIDMPWDRYPAGNSYPLYRYAEAALIRVEGLEHVDLLEDSNGGLSVVFRPVLPACGEGPTDRAPGG